MEDNNNDEISLKEISLKIKSLLLFLLTQWGKIFIAGAIGAALGFVLVYNTPLVYKAKLSFVVEEGKSSGGGLASLAGQFGFDVGGSGGNGLLSGENLLLFLKSASLTRDVLLSPYDSAKNYSLADKYADEYKLRKKWAENKKIGKQVYFPVIAKQPYTRLQDSLIQVITSYILKSELLIDRPEKKASFISVETNMRDELLSKYYCERLVQKATERYVQSKIRRQKINVDRLQNRADSIAAALNNKTYNNAFEQERVLDVNPGARTATVNAEVSTRDKMMLTTIYGEVVKNLEIAKVQLTQETPTVQVVDGVDLPLKITKVSKLNYLIIGGLISGLIVISVLSIKRMF